MPNGVPGAWRQTYHISLNKAGCRAVEDVHTRPANEPIVERLVSTKDFGGILPLQTIAGDVDYPADHTQVVRARDAVRLWEIVLNTA